MQKALGIGKGKPASERKIALHKEETAKHEALQRQVASLRGILQKLRDAYTQSKGDCPPGRYGELKSMIKNSIQQYRDTQHKDNSGNERRGKRSKPVGNLLANARAFADVTTDVQQQAEFYSEMTSEKIKVDLKKLNEENERLGEDVRKLQSSLEHLAEEYEDSKQFLVNRRYQVLKDMIKDITKKL